MYFFRYQHKKLLPILVNRAVIFFLVMSLVTLFLYAAGTVQDFVDSTQLSLLTLYAALGIPLTIASVVSMILNVGRFIEMRKKRYLFRAAGYVLLALFSAVTVLAVMFITVVGKVEA